MNKNHTLTQCKGTHFFPSAQRERFFSSSIAGKKTFPAFVFCQKVAFLIGTYRPDYHTCANTG